MYQYAGSDWVHLELSFPGQPTPFNGDTPGAGGSSLAKAKQENRMTTKIDTSQQSISAHGCCGGQPSKEKAALAPAKPEAAPSSAAKRSAPAEAAGSCCHGEGSSNADQKRQHGHQS